MAGCPQFEALILERASGPIPAEEQARLSEHLSGCAGCQHTLDEAEALFGTAALPAASPEEQRRALTGLPEKTRAALRAADRRRSWTRGASAGLLAAAAALLVVLAPKTLRHPAHPVPTATATTAQQAEPAEVEESDVASWALADPVAGDLSSEGAAWGESLDDGSLSPDDPGPAEDPLELDLTAGDET